jgi:hypothetical protein
MTSREYVLTLNVSELRDILGADIVAALTTLPALDHAIDVAVAVLERDEDRDIAAQAESERRGAL